MHLRNRPWKFEKDGDVVYANYTAEARDYVELGYERVVENKEEVIEEVKPRVEEENEEDFDFELLTRNQLMKLLEEEKIPFKNTASKAELVKLCQELDDE